jgi:hypothetical protein
LILVDTSVSVEHLRARNAALVGLPERGAVLVHLFVAGEVALGRGCASGGRRRRGVLPAR